MTNNSPIADERANKNPVEIKDLSVSFYSQGKLVPAVKNVSFNVEQGQIVALVGESGSGKSTTAMAIAGLLPSNIQLEGSILITENGSERSLEIVGCSEKTLAQIRGNKIGVIFQEPMTALNPVFTIGWQVVESVRKHTKISKKDSRETALRLLRKVNIPFAEKKAKNYPHQLSGGQKQRVVIASALANSPALLIADEPTTALDVTVQAEILDLMRKLSSDHNSSVIIITHDMGVVADIADVVIVMRHGEIVEKGKVETIFHDPQHEYTQQLLAAVPKLGRSPKVHTESKPDQTSPIFVAENLTIQYPGSKKNQPFTAIDNVNFSIDKGEVVGLVGESGSGKSTIGTAAVGLTPISGGKIVIAGTEILPKKALSLRQISDEVSIVFQDPSSSLNPRITVGQSLTEPLRVKKELDGPAITRRMYELLDSVELPRDFVNRYPHELSGGQKQRIGIARALAMDPKILIADEPTSALDVSVQATVLDIFRQLQKELGFACLFISHDLAVIEQLSSRVAVLNKGKLVEFAQTQQILHNPQNPYTQRLISAIPVPEPQEQRRRREKRLATLSAT